MDTLKPAKELTLLVAGLVGLVLLLGCTGELASRRSVPNNLTTPEPTPNIEAMVQVSLATAMATIAAPAAEEEPATTRTPTATPTFTPMPSPTPTVTSTPTPVPTFTPTPSPTPTITPTHTPTPTPTATPTPSPTPTPTPLPTTLERYDGPNAGYIRWNYPAIYNELHTQPWAKSPNPLTDYQYEIIKYIYYLALDDNESAEKVAGMPFLQEIDQEDYLVVRALNRAGDRGYAGQIVAFYQDMGGIKDKDRTRIIAASTNNTLEGIMHRLAKGYLSQQTRVYQTPFTPSLRVTVMRSSAIKEQYLIEHTAWAAGWMEELMGEPLPVSHVILAMDTKSVTPQYAGTNFGVAMSYDEAREQPLGTWDANSLRTGVVHEVAHYFWNGMAGWIDEGMANMAEVLAADELHTPQSMTRTKRENCTAHNLSQLGDPRIQNVRQYHCNYYLGQLLFMEILETYGEERFVQSARDLYHLAKELEHNTEGKGEAGIEEVREAFAYASEIVERHWSGDINTPDKHDIDDSIRYSHPDAIEWIQKPTYSNGLVTFHGKVRDGYRLHSPTLHDARQGGYPNFTWLNPKLGDYVGSILPKLTGNSYWTLDDPGDVVADQYRIDDGTFYIAAEFYWVIGDPQDFVVRIGGIELGTGNRTALDYSYIRVNR